MYDCCECALCVCNCVAIAHWRHGGDGIRSTTRRAAEWSSAPSSILVVCVRARAGLGSGRDTLTRVAIGAGALLTGDDRSGIMYEIDGMSEAWPRWVLGEGDGRTKKGFKIEWATVKVRRITSRGRYSTRRTDRCKTQGEELYVGSFGKEYVRDGVAAHHNNEWVKIIDKNGAVRHVNWIANFEAMRRVTGTLFPGCGALGSSSSSSITWS